LIDPDNVHSRDSVYTRTTVHRNIRSKAQLLLWKSAAAISSSCYLYY